jgi:hypothetical protein
MKFQVSSCPIKDNIRCQRFNMPMMESEWFFMTETPAFYLFPDHLDIIILRVIALTNPPEVTDFNRMLIP